MAQQRPHCSDPLNDRRVSESEDDDEERRGSLPFLTNRRGSKLTDILKYNQEKRRRNRDKRYKDKQGFVWRRVVPDDDLPISRTPHPHLPGTPRTITPPHLPGSPKSPALSQGRLTAQIEPEAPPQLNHEVQQSPNPRLSKIPKISSIDTEDVYSSDPRNHGPPATDPGSGQEVLLRAGYLDPSRGANTDFSRDGSLPPDYPVPKRPRDPDTCSLHSNRSENSFKTCSSEPQLNLIPRQVSENYSAAGERSAQDRKTSMRALKQQYTTAHLNNTSSNNGALRQNVGQTKTGR